MKDLEKALSHLATKDIRVPEFKRDLRRELMRAERAGARGARTYRLPFLISGAAALALALVVVFFVAEPDLPRRLNDWALGSPESSAGGDRSYAMETTEDKVLQDLLRRNGATEDLDRAFLREYYGDSPAMPVSVGAVEDERVYAVRRYRLQDGKSVMVYTELEAEQPRRERSRTEAEARPQLISY